MEDVAQVQLSDTTGYITHVEDVSEHMRTDVALFGFLSIYEIYVNGSGVVV